MPTIPIHRIVPINKKCVLHELFLSVTQYNELTQRFLYSMHIILIHSIHAALSCSYIYTKVAQKTQNP